MIYKTKYAYILKLQKKKKNLDFVGHEVEKLREFDGAVAIGVDLTDHIMKLLFGRILIQRADHSGKFISSDAAITIFVEQTKRLFELHYLFLR